MSRAAARRRPAVLALVLGLAGGAAACRHAAPQGPERTIAAFADAVERKDWGAAYALMSEDYRQRVALVDFRAQLDAGGAETAAAAHKLREAAPRGELRVEIEIDLGEKLPLVLENGAWRVDSQPFDFYSQKTPRAALRSFIRALERRRYDVVERLVPARYRQTVTPEKLREYWEGERAADNQKLLRELRAHVAARIVEEGDEAHMPYGVKSEVRFVREDGLWRIEDPD